MGQLHLCQLQPVLESLSLINALLLSSSPWTNENLSFFTFLVKIKGKRITWENQLLKNACILFVDFFLFFCIKINWYFSLATVKDLDNSCYMSVMLLKNLVLHLCLPKKIKQCCVSCLGLFKWNVPTTLEKLLKWINFRSRLSVFKCLPEMEYMYMFYQNNPKLQCAYSKGNWKKIKCKQ